MIRSKLLLTTGIIASVVLTACTDTTAVPKQTLGPTTVVSPSRSGVLHLMKECSQYTSLAGSFCTITFSDLREIAVGSRLVYVAAAGATSLSSDVVLGPSGSGNDALGHCDLDLATDLGTCTFSGGTGDLAGFHASVVVAYPGGNNWYMDGTYSFTP